MPAQGFYSERTRGDVIRLRGRIGRGVDGSETSSPPTSKPSSGSLIIEAERVSPLRKISAEDLYIESTSASPVVPAIRLLSDTLQLLSDSIRATSEGQTLESDLYVQRVRTNVRKLFMFRIIGDGYGALIDAL